MLLGSQNGKGTVGTDPPDTLSAAEKEAWRDGWNAANVGSQNRPRPNYQTSLGREAFDRGWQAWFDDHLNLL